MDKLLIDLCHRLPYHLKGKLEMGDKECDCELVGIDIKDQRIDVLVDGLEKPWNCDYYMFKPYLKPLFPTIYEEQEDGKVPWLEFKKRWYDEGTDELGSKFLDSLISWEFKHRVGKWWYFNGKMKVGNEKTSDVFETATFYHYLAYQVAYEMGIDVEGLIDEGKAILWKP